MSLIFQHKDTITKFMKKIFLEVPDLLGLF